MVNAKGKTALIPRYITPKLNDDEKSSTGDASSSTAYTDQVNLSGYEQAVQKAYEDAGYQAVFLAADDLIRDGGAIHCSTQQMGFSLEAPNTRAPIDSN